MFHRSLQYFRNSVAMAFLAVFCCVDARAQSSSFPDILNPPDYGRICKAEVRNGDTIPVVSLDVVYINAPHSFHSRRRYEQWTRVKYNVKKVYPYAIIAAARLREFDRKLLLIQGEKQRKAYVKVCETQLRNEFEEELKALTVTQGKILMKLINRETGRTTYDVVRQMRGGFQASMWQGLARIFGHNLKAEYDASDEDAMIEYAVKLVETGRF